MTYCNNCGGAIPLAVMIRAKWKARYCKGLCREEHKKRIKAERRAYREKKGCCPQLWEASFPAIARGHSSVLDRHGPLAYLSGPLGAGSARGAAIELRLGLPVPPKGCYCVRH